MAVSSTHLVELITGELSLVRDETIRAQIRAMLVVPAEIECSWDYWEWDKENYRETYPCWMVLADAAGSRIAIVFCEHGFGPARPWGLIGMNRETPSMGPDSVWFETFLEAAADILDLPLKRLIS